MRYSTALATEAIRRRAGIEHPTEPAFGFGGNPDIFPSKPRRDHDQGGPPLNDATLT